jgi:sporulation protein YunB
MEIRIRPRRKKAWLVLAAAALLFALSAALINAQLRPAMEQLAKTRVQAVASDAMYEAVLDCINAQPEDVSYVDILQTNDQVYYVEINNKALALLSAQCARAVQDRLLSVGEQGIAVPMGTASGLPLFAGSGPMLRMTFTPESSAQAAFSSEFRTAGINQTLHRIQMRITAQIAVALPGSTMSITAETEVPVAEHIIVGKVPEAFTDVNNEEDMLKLIPDSW